MPMGSREGKEDLKGQKPRQRGQEGGPRTTNLGSMIVRTRQERMGLIAKRSGGTR